MPLVKGKSEHAFTHNIKAELAAGKPMAQSLAIAYAQKRKAHKMAEGGPVEQELDPTEHPMDHGDVVGKAMKRYSQGGTVSNEGEDELSHLADSKPNNFDDLALDDSLESVNTGASSGDFLGNAQETEDRQDIVSRIMKQRSMKQSNPRPA